MGDPKVAVSPSQAELTEIGVESSPSSSYEELVRKDSIVVFGRDSCPFCTELERTLNDRATSGHAGAAGGKSPAAWSYYRLNRLENGGALHDALKAGTGQTSVPYLFVDGELVGGADDLATAAYDGSRPGLLGGGAVAADVDAPRCYPTPFGLFPTTVDNRAVRMLAVLRTPLIALAAILCAAGGVHEAVYSAGKWLALGLFADFCLGTFGGSNASAVGAIALAVVGAGERVMGGKPRFVTGAPKQFASAVGVLFSGLAALFFMLAPEHGVAFKWIGFFWAVGLLGAVALNGFVDFCLGCVFFALGIRFGVFPKTLYTRSITEKPDLKWTWADTNKRVAEGAPEAARKRPAGRAADSRVDLSYKVKSDDQRREACHPVKHFHASYWAMPLSLFALAYAFLLAAVSGYRDSAAPFRLDIPILVPRILALLALIVWLAFAVLQAARACVFPRKVRKEFANPACAPSFLFATMCLLLLSAGIMADLPTSEGWARVAKALFWIAAPAQLVVSMLAVAHWLLYLREWEHLTPLWLAVPLANLFGALAWAAVYRKVGEAFNTSAGALWFGFALLLFFALYPLALYKVALGHNQDGVRPAHWLLIAAPAVVAVAWQFLQGGGSGLFSVLYLGALALVPVLAWGIWPVRFYLSGRWSMANWAIAFTCSAIALAAVTHHALCGPGATLSMVIAYVALAVSSYANLVCLGHFLRDAFTFKVFTAEKDATPLALMKLTHEAIRGLSPKVQLALERAGGSTAAARAFGALWDDLALVMHVHMCHEDAAIFPAADGWLPHHTDPFAEEHREDERNQAEIAPHISALRDALAAGDDAAARAAVAALQRLVPAHLAFELRHLRHEEDHLSPLLRKNLSHKELRAVIGKAWDVTAPADRFRFFPLVVKHQRRHPERLAFLQVLLQAMPERGRQIGVMLALGLEPATWQRIAQDMPDLVPRGMSGYRRFA